MNTIKDIKVIAFSIWGAVLFFLVLREAILIPLTHDEYSTIMTSYQPVWDIITYKDPIPNNHILNTLLLKINIIIFGDHLITNRIHNALAFIPFFIFSILIAKKVTPVFLFQCFFLAMISLQPYLLDFFSVSRGYGLSVVFQVISIYYAIIYTQSYQSKNLLFSLSFAAIGVLANFTLLNYFIPLSIILLYYSIKIHYNANTKELTKVFVGAITIMLILGTICYLPFTRMMATNQFVFWSSNNFFSDTVIPLFSSLRSGVYYFNTSDKNYAIFFLIYLISLTFISIFLFGKNLQNKRMTILSLLFLFGTILYNNVQFYILKVPFLNARTSLLFVPLVAFNIFSMISELNYKTYKLTRVIAISTILFCAQHFIRGYNGRVNYEWYFDQNTYEVLDEIMYRINSENRLKPVLLDCHWYYHPSLTYHINQKYRGIITLVPYHKETNPESDAVFYFAEPNESNTLDPKFDRVKDFGLNQSVLWLKQ